ncbi:MAG: hypothetical protein IIA59_00360 [Candidatus Marinimicrobia bacterium]|nr:hypothetical protein [Candidatus Neomarinimicrobiota bacterium]
MPSGWSNVFEINLLLRPGLQGVVEIPSEAEVPQVDADEALADRLVSRGGEVAIALEAEVGVALPVPVGRPWLVRLVVAAVIMELAFLSYQSLTPVRSAVDRIVGWAAGTISAGALRPAPVPQVMQISATFLDALPNNINISYLEAGAGLLLYHIEGGIDIDLLKGVQAGLEGYQLGDVLSITGERAEKLVGAVTYRDQQPMDIWRPESSVYDRFFNNLRRSISARGGEVTHTSVASQRPGEYVIAGDLGLVRAHLRGVLSEPIRANYHRVILLENPEGSRRQYFLRVVFDLVLEGVASQPRSSQAGTAD